MTTLIHLITPTTKKGFNFLHPSTQQSKAITMDRIQIVLNCCFLSGEKNSITIGKTEKYLSKNKVLYIPSITPVSHTIIFWTKGTRCKEISSIVHNVVL